MKILQITLKAICLPLIIFITAFFFFMQASDSLQAQEAPDPSRYCAYYSCFDYFYKKGWSVGYSPLIFGANKIETKTTIVDTVETEIVVSDLTADLRTDIYPNTFTDKIQEVAVNICEGTETRTEIFYLAADHSDATDLTAILGWFVTDARFRLHGEEIPYTRSFDERLLSPIADDECKKAFDALLVEDLASADSLTKIKGKALAGNGFQVGYRNGDYRYSFTNYSWEAGTDKLDSQVLLLEYFINKGFSVGIGVADVKLDSSLGIHSQRANVYSLSYQLSILKNLFIEASYMLIAADISVQKEERVEAFEAVNQTDTRELGFYGHHDFISGLVAVYALNLENNSASSYNGRSTVTRTQTRAAGSRAITKSVEIKNPAAFSIKFVWNFF